MPRHSELDLILEKIWAGGTLTRDELRAGRQASSTSDPDERTKGCEIILRRSEASDDQELAMQAVSELCKNSVTDEGDYRVSLLIVLLCVTSESFHEFPEFIEFAYRAALSRHWAVRTNAMSILGRIALTGEARAVEILRDRVNDPNEYVRENAILYLERSTGSV